jgi:hypothetical protein
MTIVSDRVSDGDTMGPSDGDTMGPSDASKYYGPMPAPAGADVFVVTERYSGESSVWIYASMDPALEAGRAMAADAIATAETDHGTSDHWSLDEWDAWPSTAYPVDDLSHLLFHASDTDGMHHEISVDHRKLLR